MRMQSGKWLPSKSPAQSLEQIHMEVYGLLSSFTMSLLSDHSSLSSKPCKWQPKQKPCCFQRWYKQAHYSQRLVLLLRLGVEKGRGSFPQSKWQSRSIFKVKFLMRTLQKFFPLENVNHLGTKLFIRIDTLVNGKKCSVKLPRKKYLFLLITCLSELGFQAVIFNRTREDLFQIQNWGFLEFWFCLVELFFFFS